MRTKILWVRRMHNIMKNKTAWTVNSLWTNNTNIIALLDSLHLHLTLTMPTWQSSMHACHCQGQGCCLLVLLLLFAQGKLGIWWASLLLGQMKKVPRFSLPSLPLATVKTSKYKPSDTAAPSRPLAPPVCACAVSGLDQRWIVCKITPPPQRVTCVAVHLIFIPSAINTVVSLVIICLTSSPTSRCPLGPYSVNA